MTWRTNLWFFDDFFFYEILHFFQEEALSAFVQPETLSGTNQYHCETCNKKCDAHKGLKFVKFPYFLTLQLKRFDFDYNTFHRIKLNDEWVWNWTDDTFFVFERFPRTQICQKCRWKTPENKISGSLFRTFWTWIPSSHPPRRNRLARMKIRARIRRRATTVQRRTVETQRTNLLLATTESSKTKTPRTIITTMRPTRESRGATTLPRRAAILTITRTKRNATSYLRRKGLTFTNYSPSWFTAEAQPAAIITRTSRTLKLGSGFALTTKTSRR